MTDETEPIRRQRLAEINAEPGSREALEASTARCGTLAKSPKTSRCWASWHPTSSFVAGAMASRALWSFSTSPGSTSTSSPLPDRQDCDSMVSVPRSAS